MTQQVRSKTSNIQIKIQLYLAIYLGCHLTTSDAEGALGPMGRRWAQLVCVCPKENE